MHSETLLLLHNLKKNDDSRCTVPILVAEFLEYLRTHAGLHKSVYKSIRFNTNTHMNTDDNNNLTFT